MRNETPRKPAAAKRWHVPIAGIVFVGITLAAAPFAQALIVAPLVGLITATCFWLNTSLLLHTS